MGDYSTPPGPRAVKSCEQCREGSKYAGTGRQDAQHWTLFERTTNWHGQKTPTSFFKNVEITNFFDYEKQTYLLQKIDQNDNFLEETFCEKSSPSKIRRTLQIMLRGAHKPAQAGDTSSSGEEAHGGDKHPGCDKKTSVTSAHSPSQQQTWWHLLGHGSLVGLASHGGRGTWNSERRARRNPTAGVRGPTSIYCTGTPVWILGAGGSEGRREPARPGAACQTKGLRERSQ